MLMDVEIAELRKLFWYSAIELQPGLFTRSPDDDGRLPYWTMSLARQAIEQMDLRGKRCLDVGAVDGFMAALMKRMGADSVTATDCCDYSQQIFAVQKLLGLRFQYLPNIGTLKMVDRLIDAHKFGERFFIDHGRPDTDFGFDLVNCSGVMYHLYSPLHLIGALRTLVRPGGLVLIETALIPSDCYYMSFNYFGGGRYIYAASDTWFITPPLMEYLLRMFSLQPIDVVYRHHKTIDAERSVGRGSIVCRAVDAPIALPSEFQMPESVRTFEFDELYKRELEGLKKPATMAYSHLVGDEHWPEEGGVKHLDLLSAVRAQEAMPIDYERAILRWAD
jgi:SAM-dependent methyltransferase